MGRPGIGTACFRTTSSRWWSTLGGDRRPRAREHREARSRHVICRAAQRFGISGIARPGPALCAVKAHHDASQQTLDRRLRIDDTDKPTFAGRRASRPAYCTTCFEFARWILDFASAMVTESGAKTT
jgi:hypothetical protein